MSRIIDGARSRRGVSLLPADLEEFSVALREACPGVRFLRREYWEKRNADGKRIPMEPPRLQLQYFDSLSVPGEYFLAMWVEPEGWTPEWYEEFQMEYPHIDDTGRQWPFLWKLRNEPECMFHLEIGRVMPGFVMVPGTTPPYPKYEFISGSSIFSRYVRDDKEQKAAHSSIWRALSKQTTGKLLPYDVKRQRPYRE